MTNHRVLINELNWFLTPVSRSGAKPVPMGGEGGGCEVKKVQIGPFLFRSLWGTPIGPHWDEQGQENDPKAVIWGTFEVIFSCRICIPH